MTDDEPQYPDVPPEMPLRLRPNPVRRRHYRAGSLVQAFRSRQDADPAAEDWLSSDVNPRHAQRGSAEGIGVAEWNSGCCAASMRDVLTDMPSAVGGGTESSRRSIGYLVKLLDPDRRLPIHCHPTRAFADRYFGAPVGKTEAWVVLRSAGTAPNAWIGFKKPITPAEWKGLIASQDSGALLDALHEYRLEAGDVAFVPAGTPHAMGPDILVLEPQEPSDWSILAEYASFGIEPDKAMLGLDLEQAVSCFDLRSYTREEAECGLVHRGALRDVPAGVSTLIERDSAEFFRIKAIRAETATAFSETTHWTGVVVSGAGRVASESGSLDVSEGDAFFCPPTSGAVHLTPDGATALLVVATLPPNNRP